MLDFRRVVCLLISAWRVELRSGK